MATEEVQCNLLPHHEQKELCTTRLPYRQGRKLTAVKVYTVNNESKHILIFGVPSLNLRQETKTLFMKFGKLLQFNLTKYPSEQFTEAYHAVYESIQSARVAKKMLDTKNYYGGNLHISYAPELETVEETREKLMLRKTQVNSRLKNLDRDTKLSKLELENKIEERLNNETEKMQTDLKNNTVEKMYMGTTNKIIFGKRKIKNVKQKINKKIKIIHPNTPSNIDLKNSESKLTDIRNTESNLTDVSGPSSSDTQTSNIDIIEFTSPNIGVISNINDALNYNKFGNEIIKEVPYKPINRIKFNINKKS